MHVTPASTAIRTKSVRNVETERLHRRLTWLRIMFAEGWTSYERTSDGRASFGDRVRETVNIERELTRRGEHFVLVTDGKHLSVDVHAVPTMGPRPSRKELEARR